MSSISNAASFSRLVGAPTSRSGPGPLRLTIDAQVRDVQPATLDPAAADALDEQLRQTAGPTRVELPADFADWPDDARQQALDLLVEHEARLGFVGPGTEAVPLADAVVRVAGFIAGNPQACVRRRGLLTDLAALSAGDDPTSAAQLLAGWLRAAGHTPGRQEHLRAEVQRRRQGWRAAGAGDTPAGRPVRDTLPDAPGPEGLVVPTGYRIDETGVYLGEEQVCDIPVILIGTSRDAVTEAERVTVAYRQHGRWHSRTVDRSGIAKKTKLVELADKGLPFHDESAGPGVVYLAACLTANRERLQPVVTSAQLGWTPDRRGLLLGRRYLGDPPAVEFRGADDGDEQAADAFQTGGTYDGWLELIDLIRPFPHALFGFYASFVPVLAPLIGCSNFLVDYCGPTSCGKTTAVEVIASGWGNPDRSSPNSMVKSWNMTKVARERWAAVCRHLAVVFDESQLVGDPAEVAQTVYEIAQGQSRGRGSLQGLRHQAAIQTVAFTTGERPLNTFTQDGGIRGRVLVLPGSPFGEAAVDPALPARLRAGARRHFGHAGERFVQHLLAHREDWGEWAAEFVREREGFERREGASAVAVRMGEYLAAVRVASRLAHEALALPWAWADPVEPLYGVLTAGAADADRSLAALRHVMDWAYAHRDHFQHGEGVYGADRGQPSGGWLGKWELTRGATTTGHLFFFNHRLREVLDAGGFVYDAVVPVWKQKEWLDTDRDTSGRTTKTTRFGEGSSKMVAIRQSAIEAQCGPVGA